MHESLLGKSASEGESPARHVKSFVHSMFFRESRFLGLECKVGGKSHPKMNSGSKPIADKYHEGKMKRTLKRGLTVPETAERKVHGTNFYL